MGKGLRRANGFVRGAAVSLEQFPLAVALTVTACFECDRDWGQSVGSNPG